MQEDLLAKSNLLQQSINPYVVLELSKDDSSEVSAHFQSLKKHLETIQKLESNYDTIEILFRSESGDISSQLTVNGLDQTDKGEPPLVTSFSDGYQQTFEHGKPQVIGPFLKYGKLHVKAILPILDRIENHVIALTTVDIETADWNQRLVLSILPLILVTAILLGIVALFVHGRKYQQHGAIHDDTKLFRRERALTASAGIALTLLTAYYLHTLETRKHTLNAMEYSRFHSEIVANSLVAIEELKLGALSSYLSSKRRLRDNLLLGDGQVGFERFSKFLLKEPAIHAVEWVPAVPHSMKEEFEAKFNESGSNDFSIHPFQSGSSTEIFHPSFYFPVTYMSPLKGNESGIGKDLASEVKRRVAIEKALATNLTVATEPIQVLQDGGESQSNLLIFDPIIGSGERSGVESFFGFAVAVLRMQDFLEQNQSDLIEHVEMFVWSDGNSRNELISETGDYSGYIPQIPLTRYVSVFGKTFSILSYPGPVILKQNHRVAGLIVLFLGLIITSAMTFLRTAIQVRSRDFKLQVLKSNQELSVVQKMRLEQERIALDLTTLIDTANAPIFGIDKEGKVTEWNQTAERITGYTKSETMGSPMVETFITDEYKSSVQEVLDRALDGRETANYEFPLYTKGGERVDVLLNSTTRRDAQGEIVGVVGVGQDITELNKIRQHLQQLVRERTAELAGAKDAAEAANRAKSVFLANMSHEIRTPLNAILGLGTILGRDEDLSIKQRDHLGTINRSGRHLSHLINDILDLSKIEAGRMEVICSDFGLFELIKDLEFTFRSRAEGKNLQFDFNFNGNDDNRYIHADEDKLRQVCNNLIGNAIKFTETGVVSVMVNLEPCEPLHGEYDADNRWFQLKGTVTDTGPGIADEDLPRIFETFGQLETGKESKGTGLGLSISYRLMEMMDGTLEVKSKLGEGSVFSFSLKVRAARNVQEPLASPVKLIAGLSKEVGEVRLLIVDDNVDNRRVLQELLEPIGFKLNMANNGKEALNLNEKWFPHAILMDVRMPIMDGLQATRYIKSGSYGVAVPVIAITAGAFDDEKEEAFASGVDAYIRKPVDLSEILGKLGQLLNIHYKQDVLNCNDNKFSSLRDPLTQEELSRLPEGLVSGMKVAVQMGDMEEFSKRNEIVRKIMPELAELLHRMADNYEYASLRRLLSSG
ncbi:MAG: CHASE domain-containing protein [Verrucomicrobiota bacterium]|nr:CHASE domain-containing protein [Verrucomicrobiota bacterium]